MPEPLTLVPVRIEMTLVVSLWIFLWSLDQKQTQIPISEDWLRLMQPLFKRVSEMLLRSRKTSFSLEIGIDHILREVALDTRSLPPPVGP